MTEGDAPSEKEKIYMAIYFAVFAPEQKGGYFATFPDFPEAFTQGQDFEEAIVMADDVLRITLEEYVKARKQFPTPSTFDAIKTWAENNLEELGQPGHIRIQAYTAPNVDMTPVRVTVSFSKAILENIDAKAKQAGYTRSGFLAAAAQSFQP